MTDVAVLDCHHLALVPRSRMLPILIRSVLCLVIGSAVSAESAIAPGDTAALQRAVQIAITAGTTQLRIPPGVYRFPATRTGMPHLLIENASGLTIDGAGATLVFAGRDQPGLSVRNSRQVTLRGLRLERAVPPCSQGRIERLEEDGRFCVVRIDAGYPQDVDDRRFFTTFWCNLFTADRHAWVAHYRGVTPTEITRLAPDLIRVRMHTRPGDLPVPLVPGLPVAWRGIVVDDLEVRSGEECVFENITVAGGAGMCFHERGGGGNRYIGCSVVLAARPAGASEDPLLASSADGFHSSGARRGPLLDRCSFTGLDDDAIAIHGSYALAMEAHNEVLVVWRARYEENRLYGEPGDTLRFYDEHSVRAGEAVIRSVRRLDGYVPPVAPDPVFKAFSDPGTGTFLEITCDRPVPCRPNWLVSNPTCAGSGYVIRDCIIRDCFARGILAKGSDGLIEGNLIERMARSAIEFNPEMAHWSENDYGVGVVVRGNTIRQASRNRQVGELRHPGAMTLFGFRNGAYVPAPGGHRDILIADNRFEDNDGPNLLITSAQGVRITGNRFVRPMRLASTFGSDKGVDPDALIWCAESRDVILRGNLIEDAGPAMLRLVAAGPGWTLPADQALAFDGKP
jgi:hypothetical protein